MITIIHEVIETFYTFKHRLLVGGKAGDYVGYADIAINGEYRAVIQDYWGMDVPEVYRVLPVTFTKVNIRT